jgi:hypothetical protein
MKNETNEWTDGCIPYNPEALLIARIVEDVNGFLILSPENTQNDLSLGVGPFPSRAQAIAHALHALEYDEAK